MMNLDSKEVSLQEKVNKNTESPIHKALDSHFLKYYPSMKPSVLKAGAGEMHEVSKSNSQIEDNFAFAGMNRV